MEKYIVPAALLLLVLQEIRMIIKRQKLRRIKKRLQSLVKEKEKLRYENQQVMKTYKRLASWELHELLPENESDGSLEGIIGLVTMEQLEHKKIQQICKCQKEQQGILLPDNLNLTAWKILFLNQGEQALQFAIDTLSGFPKDDNAFTILFHHASCHYGIAGNSERAYSYFISKESDAFGKYLLQLRDAAVKLAITKKVHDQLSSNIKSRYIGYLELSGEPQELYEILDTCQEPERTQKIKADKSFQNGLQLYYKNDFYLARSYFAKVIRECPSDLIAKWYIFSSEKIMDGKIDDTEFHYGLFHQ